MAKILEVHPQNPQMRLIKMVAEVLNHQGVIIYPSDSSYAFACLLDNKKGVEHIQRIKQIKEDHWMSLVCRNLTDISHYARIDNRHFRLLKQALPGPYTFILEASKEIPKRLQSPKRKTIGLRVPDSAVVQAILEAVDSPILSSSVGVAGQDVALDLCEAYELEEAFGKQVDLIVDAGRLVVNATTVVDLTSDTPAVIRPGAGKTDWLE